MDRLTIEQLNAIRERAEDTSFDKAYVKGDPWKGYEVRNDNNGLIIAETSTEADAEFIANARQDIPALLAEVEYLNGVIGALRSSLGEIWHYVEGNGNLLVQEAIKYAEENLR